MRLHHLRLQLWSKLEKDVLDNFTEKQSEKIFSEMRKYGNKYIFVQKKLPTFKDEDGLEWIGYDYIARRS